MLVRRANSIMMKDLHEEGSLTEADKTKRRLRREMVNRMRRRGGLTKALEFIEGIPVITRGQVWSRYTLVEGQQVLKFYAITRRRLTRGWLKVYTEYGGDMSTRPREFFLKEGAEPRLVREFERSECAREFVDAQANKKRRAI